MISRFMRIRGCGVSARLCVLVTGVVFSMAVPVFGQLSPGKLQRVHANLEGLKNCEKCHSAGQQIDDQKCLECHTMLADRIKAGKGLHANNEYSDCVTCHVEHMGEDADLVWWRDGQDKFDHSLAGYQLEGKHVGVQCRSCHRPDHMTDKAELVAKHKDVNRTFLGLSRDCVSCHRDEHRGQFSQDCGSCHNMTGWRTATRFDHNKTKFPLTGLHQKVDCSKCHRVVTDNKFRDDTSFVQFANVKYQLCSDCHQDVHKGRFKKTCDQCHTTAGWKQVAAGEFDHSKTRFPLLGKHNSLECKKCHLPGSSVAGLAFGRCLDCHADYHQGQFVAGSSVKDCEACHTVNSFKPSTFTVAMHQESKYRLEGSHLAVPCIACHTMTKLHGTETMRFAFSSTRCLDCHKDPHKGQLDKYVSRNGCEFCHSVQSWRKVTYDHGKTKFALTGKHANVLCTKCHKPEGTGDQQRLQFTSLKTDCASCHEDVHKGQFAVAAALNARATKCERCHTTTHWKPDLFDHNRDAKFKLVGAHRKVACTGCHKKISKGETTFIWFKPVDTACSSCHNNADTLRLSENG